VRVQLAEGWHIRPTQDGLELMAPERNIALELSDLAFRDELAAVLTGESGVSNDSKQVEDVLQQLKTAGAILLQETSIRHEPKGDETAWKIRRDLVGSRGPVISVYWLDPKQSRLSLSRTHLFTAKYRERTGHGEEIREEWTSGSDPNWEWAEFKAIMEAAERHACGVIPQEQLVRSTARKLGDQAISPKKVVAYTKAQYRNGLPFIPFSKDREYWWKSVSILPGGEEKYLPVECLYYPVEHELTPNSYTAASSSGVAAGLSFEDALLRALYEAIERDAFMVAWLNRASMPLIDQQTIPEDCRERVRSLESLGYRLHVVDITLEFSSVVLALAVNEQVQPALVLGAAANPDIEQAVSKALGEVENQLYWERRNPENVHSISDATEVSSVLDHAALYASPAYLPKAAFLWSGKTQPMSRLNSSIQDVSIILGKLKQHGIETAVLNLTPEYIKKAGVYVVRALPLGLIPISFGYGNEPLGMIRYRQMAGMGTSWPKRVPFTHPFA
jgi:ribosomal protein S12 methylthiotransferase accessory factor